MLDIKDWGKYWEQHELIALCKVIEPLCEKHGCHVAMTGGCLYTYAPGPRKDGDLLFYRIRQVSHINKKGLFAALLAIGVKVTGGCGWVHKAVYCKKSLDLFFPEQDRVGDVPPVVLNPEKKSDGKVSNTHSY